MIGGIKALEQSKDPLIIKLEVIIDDIISENSSNETAEQSCKS